MRYLVGVNYGDGEDYYVCNTSIEAMKHIGDEVESAIIGTFEGELLSITFSGRGDLVINGEDANVVYEMADGDVLVNKIDGDEEDDEE